MRGKLPFATWQPQVVVLSSGADSNFVGQVYSTVVMGLSWNRYFYPEITPYQDSKPTFDPNYGFKEKRQPRGERFSSSFKI